MSSSPGVVEGGRGGGGVSGLLKAIHDSGVPPPPAEYAGPRPAMPVQH